MIHKNWKGKVADAIRRILEHNDPITDHQLFNQDSKYNLREENRMLCTIMDTVSDKIANELACYQ